nr:hypothetical protein [Tanacetum cinerariifolium]
MTQPLVTESSSSHDTTQDSRDSLEGTNKSEGDQGRKKDKPEPTLDDSTLDDLDVDHGQDTKEPMNEGMLIPPPLTTTSIFDDEDITMAQTLIKMKEEKAKEKGVSVKDIEDSLRPARSILTLKPLPTIDPKDKGKGVLEEPEPAKKITRSDLDAAQIAKDAEVARLVYEEELAKLEREKEKRQREEKASKAAIANMYDEVQAGIKADALFAAKLQQEEREEYTFEERAKQKRVIDDFKLMDSDDAVDKEKVLEEPDNTKIETNSDLKKEEHQKTFLQIVPNEEGEVDYEVLDKRFPIINLESKFYHLNKHGVECIYYRIFRSDGSSRWIKTLSEMVTRFDRMDLEELYNIVMQRFETTSREGVDLVLWGDLRTMFEETTDHDLWKNKEEWILKSWNFYENCGDHI